MATQINKKLTDLYKKSNAPSAHLINLNFLHLNRELFRLPNPNISKNNLPEHKLHQLRKIIIRNHPLFNSDKCPFCNFATPDMDAHLKQFFRPFWSTGSHKLIAISLKSDDHNHNSRHFIKNIINFLNSTKPNKLQQKQLLNIILTADTYINNHFLKFNIKFNPFRATWISLITECIKSKSYTPLNSFSTTQIPPIPCTANSITPTGTHLSLIKIN